MTPSAAFNGTNQYLSAADTTDIQFGDNDGTLSFWFNANAGFTDGTILVGKESGAGNQEFEAAIVSSNLSVAAFNTGGTGFSAVDATTIVPGRWYHVVYKRDKAGARIGLKVNNGAWNYTATTGTLKTVATALNLGRRAYSGFEGYLSGRLAAVGKWSRQLLDTEITSLYKAGLGLYYADLIGSLAGLRTGLQCWWDLGEYAGSRADLTGRGNTLSDNNAVLWAQGITVPLPVVIAGNSTVAYTHSDSLFYAPPTPAQSHSEDAPQSWTDSLAASLSASVPEVAAMVTNTAVPGQTQTQMLSAFATQITAHNPAIAVLKCGLNEVTTYEIDEGVTLTNNIQGWVNAALALTYEGVPIQVVLITDNLAVDSANRPYELQVAIHATVLAAYHQYAGNPRVQILDLFAIYNALSSRGANAAAVAQILRQEPAEGVSVWVHPSEYAYNAIEQAAIYPVIARAAANYLDQTPPPASSVSSGQGIDSGNTRITVGY